MSRLRAVFFVQFFTIQDKHMIQKETVPEMVTKFSAPATVSVATIAGFQIPDLVQLATLVYLVVLITYKGWHWYREYKGYKINTEDKEDDEL
jgi:hypothetical protein